MAPRLFQTLTLALVFVLSHCSEVLQQNQCPAIVGHAGFHYALIDNLDAPRITLMHIIYNSSSRSAVASAAFYNKENLRTNFVRNNSWSAWGCPNEPTDCSTPYTGTGYYRGHLSRQCDFTFSASSPRRTNYCINQAPQQWYFNQVVWRKLEDTVYNLFALEPENREMGGLVVTGISPTFIPDVVSPQRVPEFFWKMLCYYDINIPVVEAWVAYNNENAQIIAVTGRDLINRLGTSGGVVQDIWLMTRQGLINGRSVGSNPPTVAQCNAAMSRFVDNGLFARANTTTTIYRQCECCEED